MLTHSALWLTFGSNVVCTELYDYNVDQWETTNFVAVGNYSAVVKELRAVLFKQYSH